MNERERAEVERIELSFTLDRHQLLVNDYEDGIRFQWHKIADAKYRLGQLDEQLREEPGGSS